MRYRLLFFVAYSGFATATEPLIDNRYQDIEASYIGMFINPHSTSAIAEDSTKNDERLALPVLKKTDLLFASLEKLKTYSGANDPLPRTTVITSEVWQNLEIFTNPSKLPEKTVLGSIKRTKTAVGELTLTRLLLDPTTDINLVKSRQQFIKRLVSDNNLFIQISTIVDHIAAEEANLIGMLRATDTFNQESILNWFDTFGRLPSPILTSSALNFIHITSLLVMPFFLYICFSAGSSAFNLATTQKESKNIGLIAVFSAIALFAGYRTYESGNLLKNILGITTYIQRRLAAVQVLLSHLQPLISLSNSLNFPELSRYTEQYVTTTAPLLQVLHKRLSSSTFTPPSHGGMPSQFGALFSNQGTVANALLDAKKVLPIMLNGLAIIGYIDALLSLTKLIREREHTIAPYCFVSFVENSPTPSLYAEDFYHPSIPQKKIVPNTLWLGLNGNPCNIVLSGVNAGGKSTIMKALALCCVMGQSVGIAPAHRFIFTPFHTINTCLNITDDVSKKQSLFRAELARAQTLLKLIHTLPPSHFSFTILDEICTGTEALEGEALAFAIAEKLGSYSNGITLLSTHFPGLIELEAYAPHLYKNMKVVVVKDDNGNFIYPYLLQDGATTQQIAPDLLEQIGLPLVMTEKMRDVLNHPSRYVHTEDCI